MTTHITKTWFDGKNIVTQEIPESEIYKREWVGLTDEERKECIDWAYDLDGTTFAASLARMVEYKLKEKNT